MQLTWLFFFIKAVMQIAQWIQVRAAAKPDNLSQILEPTGGKGRIHPWGLFFDPTYALWRKYVTTRDLQACTAMHLFCFNNIWTSIDTYWELICIQRISS